MVCIWFSFSSGNVLVWSLYVFDIVLEWFDIVLVGVYLLFGFDACMVLMGSWYSLAWCRHSFSMAGYCYGNGFSIALL